MPYATPVPTSKQAINLQYFVNGPEVVAYGTEKSRIKGHTTDDPSWLCLKFNVSGGIITRFENYFDTQSAQKYLQQFHQKMERETNELKGREHGGA